jgi:histidinol-phosphate aminotransferase
MNPESFLRPHIRAMEAYTPILPFEVLSEQLGIPAAEIIKLDANENPYGPIPQVAEALAKLPYAHIYPDPESRLLRWVIADYTGVPFENILAGAGADELIDLIMRLLLDPGETIINCPPTFGMYSFDAGIHNARVIAVPRKADFSLDLEGIIAAVEQHQPKLIFLASPNNPDGSLLPNETLAALLELPLIVVLDEAYVDFAPAGTSRIGNVVSPSHLRPCSGQAPAPLPKGDGSSVGRQDVVSTNAQRKNPTSLKLAMRKNLVVLRTFSKWPGLAGLRVGYGVFPDWIMPHLWKIKQPYNVSVAGSVAATISLENADQLEARTALIVDERERLFRELQAIPWLQPYPSQSNFILCRVNGRNAAELKANLAKQGILIRYFDKPGLQDHIRISVGKPEHTNALIAALERYNV